MFATSIIVQTVHSKVGLNQTKPAMPSKWTTTKDALEAAFLLTEVDVVRVDKSEDMNSKNEVGLPNKKCKRDVVPSSSDYFENTAGPNEQKEPRGD